jgi:hypothetical protein
MSKQLINFYKIVYKNNPLIIYIGKTITTDLKKIFRNFKVVANKYQNNNTIDKYPFLEFFNQHGYDNFDIEVLADNFEYSDINQLNSKLIEFIEYYKNNNYIILDYDKSNKQIIVKKDNFKYINIYNISHNNNIFIYKSISKKYEILNHFKNEAIKKIELNNIDDFPFLKLYHENNYQNFIIEYIHKDFEYQDDDQLNNEITKLNEQVKLNGFDILTYKLIKNKYESSNKYQNGKIYKIIYINDTNKIYIGSTTKTLEKRFRAHIDDSKKYKDKEFNNFPKFLYENGYEQFNIELIENFPCNFRLELEKREKEIMIEYTENNYELFNIIVGGKIKEECHGYLYNKTGEEHNTFKYGNIRHDVIKNNWIFQYQENYEPKGKKWSCNKYGYDEAKKLAELFRIKTYPNCIKQFNYEYNITYDEFFDILSNNIIEQKEQENNIKPLYPKYGYITKKFLKNKNTISYEFLWSDNINPKINYSKSFCASKYGENNAKILAELYRKKTFPDYINTETDTEIDTNIDYDTFIEQVNNTINNTKATETKFKSIYLMPKLCTFTWIENNINKTKSFAVKKYGNDNAYILASLYAKNIFPDYTNDKISDIKLSYDEYFNSIN